MAASGLSVSLTLPSSSLFSFPPHSNPAFLPPSLPGTHPAAPPVAIPAHIYQAALDPRVPLTIAAVYAAAAKALNAYNKSTGKAPWAISKTAAFRAFVVAHNIFLAVYSAWTWWGMFGALRRSMVSPFGSLAGFTDSVCRLSGPAGLGRAAFYSEEADAWRTYAAGGLTAEGVPDMLDTGRIWNEGLAFYGWIFYLSKFYEVLDTFIILAKGKLSSTLQTYHHAGAMMCMWAGMRYMSPPIWMFVFVNSGIHAMMYTYYTLTTFNVRVPMLVKRTLTSMQITQFLVGASYAMVHSFVSYTVPVVVTVAENVASSDASAPATNANGSAPAASPAPILDNIKAMVFGLASSAQQQAQASPVAASDSATTSSYVQQTSVPCITTSGATFAIWLNVLYLAPLTYLFVSFFISSYIRRSSADYKNKTASGNGRASGNKVVSKLANRRLSNEVVHAEKAGWDAARSVEREVYGQDGVEEAVVDGEVRMGNANGRALRSRRA